MPIPPLGRSEAIRAGFMEESCLNQALINAVELSPTEKMDNGVPRIVAAQAQEGECPARLDKMIRLLCETG